MIFAERGEPQLNFLPRITRRTATEFLAADYAENCADWDVAGPVAARLAASLPFLNVALAQSAGSARVVTKEKRRRVGATSLDCHTDSIPVNPRNPRPEILLLLLLLLLLRLQFAVLRPFRVSPPTTGEDSTP